MAGKKAAEQSNTQIEEKPAGTEEVVPKKRGRPAKTPVDQAPDKPKQAAAETAKGTEAGQEGKRPRGRPPGDLIRPRNRDITCLGCNELFLLAGTGKKQKAAAEAAAAKDANKNEVVHQLGEQHASHDSGHIFMSVLHACRQH